MPWRLDGSRRMACGSSPAATSPPPMSGSEPVAIVNEAFVRRFVGPRNPLGQRVTGSVSADLKESVIVGVVNDAVYRTVARARSDDLSADGASRPVRFGVRGHGEVDRRSSIGRAQLDRTPLRRIPTWRSRSATTRINCAPPSCRSGWSRCCPDSSACWRCCWPRSAFMASPVLRHPPAAGARPAHGARREHGRRGAARAPQSRCLITVAPPSVSA